MKFLLLVCLLSCATGKSLLPRLPTSMLLEGSLLPAGEKIVGGTQAVANEFPWQISLQRRSGTSWAHSCGGSVYNRDYIIDAAHCVDGVGILSSLRVVAGEHSLSMTSGFEQYRNLLSIRVHEKYNPKTYANDIALLKMNAPLDFSTGKVGPISLPSAGSKISAGTTCLVSGWGTTSSGGSISDKLRKVAVPVVSNDDCNSLYEPGSILSTMMCAGFIAGGADSCQGDSGGPLVMLKPNVLVGVVSWGQGCANPGYPGVYTRVASFVNWITNNAV